jgi:hypothetical protein
MMQPFVYNVVCVDPVTQRYGQYVNSFRGDTAQEDAIRYAIKQHREDGDHYAVIRGNLCSVYDTRSM